MAVLMYSAGFCSIELKIDFSGPSAWGMARMTSSTLFSLPCCNVILVESEIFPWFAAIMRW
jgi:hypothetical protein